MEQRINGVDQYRHYPPADDVGDDSSNILNSSSIGDGQISRRHIVTNNLNLQDSDIDNEGPEDDDDDGNDLSSVYNMNRQRRQQRLRRRDTSASSICGDGAFRRRPPIGVSRSTTRVGHSIPPPPSEPPPSLPSTCGIDLNSQYSAYPVLGSGGFNVTAQQLVATQPAVLPMANIPFNFLAPSGILNPADAGQQLLQLQHTALLQQQQHQHLQQRIANANAAALGATGHSYFQSFATVGRPVRAGHINQPQMTLPHHQPLQELGFISPTAAATAMLQAAHANASQSACGSGSVVYENSYNSFQRQPPGSCVGQMPSTVSQELLSTSAGGATNADDSVGFGDIQNSTSSTTNGGAVGVETLGKSPDVVAVMSTNASTVPGPPQLMTFFDPSGGSAVGTYGTHPAAVGVMVTTQNAVKPNGLVTATSMPASRSFWRCSWQYWVILICALAFLLAVSFAVFFSENAKWLENRLHEKYTQDPAIFGLFDPHDPPQKIESGKEVQVNLDPMGIWAGHWRIQGDLCTIYNITVTSELSSIGVFLRYSTMPTIVHYNHFDRVLGRQLKIDSLAKRGSSGYSPPEAFPSVASRSYVQSNSPRTTGRVRCLKKGHWFISIVNDQPRTENIVLTMAEIVMPRGCPNDCNNRGICSQGVCDCLNGLTGKDCSSLVEVPICSGHGDYRLGRCHCHPEWKGAECEFLWSECPHPTCSDHGRCVTGECLCSDGYGGDACQLRTCSSHNCTGNGQCIEGVCRCFSGWGGVTCDLREKVNGRIEGIDFDNQRDTQLRNSPTDEVCPLNGYRDSTTGMCRCSPGFEGVNCEKDITCANRCVHGVCTGEQHRHQFADVPTTIARGSASSAPPLEPAVCQCLEGWRGINCDLNTCSPKCLSHGQCVNDTCICNPGWSGTNCNLNECPLDCSGQGHCVQSPDGHYFCECFANKKGSACQFSREVSCNDGRDDDQDGLTDCLDPDCCGTEHCKKLIQRGGNQQMVEDARQSCAHSTEVSSLILSTKMASPGSTFYDQLEFLLIRDLTTDKVNPRRVSVVRGVVRQWDSTPFWGCRIFDRLNPVIGSALTDKSGRFELVIDGGSMVQLEFIRHPTSRFTAHLAVYVPVNQIVNIGDFYLIDRSLPSGLFWASNSNQEGAVRGVGGILPVSPIFGDLWVSAHPRTATTTIHNEDHPAIDVCSPDLHDIALLGGPTIVFHTDPADTDDDLIACLGVNDDLCVARGILTHRFSLKPSNIHLVHNSNQAEKTPSFLVVSILARDHQPPDHLNEVHLTIDVAGLRQTWRFEPSQGLEFTFMWNRTNGYNRPVFGRVPTRVSVGFLYANCPMVYWEHRVALLEGHDVSPTDLSRWNIDQRHTFSPNQESIYMGDGSRLRMEGMNLMVTTVLGKPNVKRPATNRCSTCLGKARGNAILRPVAMATDETGRLYVGDGHFLRFLQTEDNIHTSDNTGYAPGVFEDHHSPDGAPRDTGSSRSPSFDWVVSDIRPMAFIGGNEEEEEEEDWPAFFMARHPIRSEELEALSRGGIGGGRAGVFISDARNKTIWWTSLERRDFSQRVISQHCPSGDPSYPDCFPKSLTDPRGLAVTHNEDLFFIDDKGLWRYHLHPLQSDKTSTPLVLEIGSFNETANPPFCGKSLPADRVSLVNPSVVAYNPVEDSIYYVDDEKYVFRLHLSSRMVSLAAGRSSDCKVSTFSSNPPPQRHGGAKAPLAVDVEFSEVRGLAFSPLGELYIAESKVIWIRRSDNRLYPFAGTKTRAAWNQASAPVSHHLEQPLTSPDQSTLVSGQLAGGTPARDFRFADITAITVGVYGEVFVADAGHNVVVAVHHESPKLELHGKYIVKGFTEEHVFDKQGQLESVVDRLTRQPIYSFNFTANGWLSSGRQGPLELFLKRNQLGLAQQIVFNTGEAYNLSLSSVREGFESIVDPYGGTQRYEYTTSGQLSRVWLSSSGLPYVASYSPLTGLLENITLPSGHLFPPPPESRRPRGPKLVPDVSATASSQVMLIDSSSSGKTLELVYAGGVQEVRFEWTDRASFSKENTDHDSWRIGRRIRLYLQHDGMTTSNPSSPSPQLIDNLVVSSFEVFGLNNDHRSAPSRQLRSFDSLNPFPFLGRGGTDVSTEASAQNTHKTLSINGKSVLSVTFDREHRVEIFRNSVSGRSLLKIIYNSNMQPIAFLPHPKQTQSGFLDSFTGPDTANPTEGLPNMHPLRIVYTRDGQIKEAFWGYSNLRLSYDTEKRLRIAEGGGTLEKLAFDYQNTVFPNLPTEVSVSGSGTYSLIYGLEGGLSHLITPSGLHRTLSLFTSIGVERLTLNPWDLDLTAATSSSFTYDWRTHTNPSLTASKAFQAHMLARFTWPSGRRVNIMPTRQLIVYDNTRILWQGHGEDLTTARSVTLRDATAEWVVQESREFRVGTLMTRVIGEVFLAGTNHPSQGFKGLLSYNNDYQYDHNFRVSEISSCLFKPKNPSPLFCHRFQLTHHNRASYSISPIGVNVVQEDSETSILWTPGALRLRKRADSHGRLCSVIMEQTLPSSSTRPDMKYPKVMINVTYTFNGPNVFPSSMTLETLGNVPLITHYKRGPGGRIESIDNEELGSSRRRHIEVVYNEDARVSDLRHFISDSQFANAEGTESKRISTRFSYDRGMVSKFGNWKYTFNEDGCLVERRLRGNRDISDLLEHDSKGLLRWVERRVTSFRNPDQVPFHQQRGHEDSFCNGFESACYPQEMGLVQDYSVQFLYDAEDRLVVVRNTLSITDVVQYFYSDPKHRNRLTSFFSYQKAKAYLLTYETTGGHLFAIEEVDMSTPTDSNHARKTYLVVTDGEGSPIALFLEDKLLWTAEYSATGGRRLINRHNVSPKLPLDDLIVPLGYRGALMNHHTGFLFHTPTWQSFDPMGATLTSPDWRRAPVERLRALHIHPEALDLHRWFPEDTTPHHPLFRLQEPLQNPGWWLHRIDSDLERIFPHLQLETGALSSTSSGRFTPLPAKCNQGLWISSNRMRLANQLNAQVERLGIVDMTKISPDTLFPTWFHEACPMSRLNAVPSMFGNDVSFGLSSDGTVSVLPGTNTSMRQAAQVLLGGTKLMDSWYLRPTSPSYGRLALVTSFVQLFVKITPNLDADLEALHLQRPELLLSRVWIGRQAAAAAAAAAASHHSGINVRLDASSDEELRITSTVAPGVEWRVRYTTDWVEASRRVLRDAQTRGVEGAGRRAASRVRSSPPHPRGPHTSPRPWPPWSSTAPEMKELQENDGEVKGYSWEVVMKEPTMETIIAELLDDPSIYQLRPIGGSNRTQTPPPLQ